MRVAIVGTSKLLTQQQNLSARYCIEGIIRTFDINKTTIISGGAYGIDTFAIIIAKEKGYATEEIEPRFDGWKAYKERNIAIAHSCDILYCITIPKQKLSCYHCKSDSHEKTAGCWTMNKAKARGKETKLIIL